MNSDGKTPLHHAAEIDDIDTARQLVEAGVDIEARTSWGATPFDWAAVMGSTRVAEYLLERGATGLTLTTSAALGRHDDVQRMLDTGIDPLEHRRRDAPRNPTDEWPPDTAHICGDVISDALYAAARNGHTRVVEVLLEHGGDAGAKGFFGASALHWAAINGHAATVDLLVRRGAALTSRDRRFDATPEQWAIEGGHTDIAARIHSASAFE